MIKFLLKKQIVRIHQMLDIWTAKSLFHIGSQFLRSTQIIVTYYIIQIRYKIVPIDCPYLKSDQNYLLILILLTSA